MCELNIDGSASVDEMTDDDITPSDTETFASQIVSNVVHFMHHFRVLDSNMI